MDRITISPIDGSWVVRAGGAVIAETDAALLLAESGQPDRVYFPRGDVAMAFLEPSDKVTTSPHMGQARYFSIITKSTTIDNAAWSYEATKDGVSEIAGHICFADGDQVAVEEL